MTAPDATSTANAPARIRTLSKSDFKIARSCEAKLYFREHGYPDARQNDPFLQMLAQGGYMVEALAKAHHPDGIEMEYGRDVEAAWRATQAALQQENVTLFEATLLHERRLARVDILVKRGNVVRLLEVKAASIDFRAHRADLEIGGSGEFRQARKPTQVIKDYREYLEDVTYQTVLLEALFPAFSVQPYLVLVDKSSTSRRSGVFDLFERVTPAHSRDYRAPKFVGTPQDLVDLPLLAEVDVSYEVDLLREEVRAASVRLASLLDAPFEAHEAVHDHECRACEFRSADGEQDGFRECWGALADVTPHVFDLFSVGKLKTSDGGSLVAQLKQAGTVSLFDVPLERLVKKDGSIGADNARRLRQIEHTRSGELYLAPTLGARLDAVTYPLHFIDFEASRVALPYHAGMSPYGLLGFQWSCHTVHAPGATPVHSEWLNIEAGWPSGEFLTSLKTCIGDTGSVLVWSPFERSTIDDLRRQLEVRRLLTPEMAAWMDGLPSRIVDLMQIAKEDYYHPLMGGRTSIKVVLDAVWQADPQVRAQCAAWSSLGLEADADPYKALPPLDVGGVAESVHDGTGAIRAYERMLFTDEGKDPEYKDQWSRLLRHYCELDTLSMVLIFEHWRRIVRP
jgi:hypothetical protein